MSSLPRSVRRLVEGPAVTAAGLAAFVACGTGAALLAAVLLDAREYTLFATYSAVLGVLVLGPASALEQEAALGAGEDGQRSSSWRLLRRSAVLWTLVLAAVLLTPEGWSARLLDDQRDLTAAALLLGAPVVFLVAVGRGAALTASRFRSVAALHVVAGAGLLVLPIALHLAGLPWLEAFIIGPLLAWVPALLLLGLLRPRHQIEPPRDPADGRVPARGGGVQVVNVLVLANLLATPAVLRWHADALSVVVTADLQLFVSISRLSTTLVLGCLPLLIHRIATTPGAARRRTILRLALASTAFGAGAALVSTVLAGALITLITGRDTTVAWHDFALASTSALLLCPAVALTAGAYVTGHSRAAVTGWAAGLLVLGAVTATEVASATVVLLGITLAALAPCVVLLGRAAAPERGSAARVAA